MWIIAAGLAEPGQAQEIGDPSRLAGVRSVAVRVTAVWDELITTAAGGATEGQFREALLMGLEAAIRNAEIGPTLGPDAPNYVLCHVDTYYDSGLIVYSVRVSHHEPDAQGRPVITWLQSWVGSYPAQQLHLMWTLADQCAKALLEDWQTANPQGAVAARPDAYLIEVAQDSQNMIDLFQRHAD